MQCFDFTTIVAVGKSVKHLQKKLFHHTSLAFSNSTEKAQDLYRMVLSFPLLNKLKCPTRNWKQHTINACLLKVLISFACDCECVWKTLSFRVFSLLSVPEKKMIITGAKVFSPNSMKISNWTTNVTNQTNSDLDWPGFTHFVVKISVANYAFLG